MKSSRQDIFLSYIFSSSSIFDEMFYTLGTDQ